MCVCGPLLTKYALKSLFKGLTHSVKMLFLVFLLFKAMMSISYGMLSRVHWTTEQKCVMQLTCCAYNNMVINDNYRGCRIKKSLIAMIKRSNSINNTTTTCIKYDPI